MFYIWLVLAACFGAFVAVIVLTALSSGRIRVDHSDPEEAPYLFLELRKPVQAVVKKRYVLFQVRAENYISR